MVADDGEGDRLAVNSTVDRQGASPSDVTGRHKKASDLRTFAELLEYAYDGKGKPFQIPASVVKALDVDSTPLSELQETVRSLAASDPLCTVPPRLLLALDRSSARGRTRRTLLLLAVLPVLEIPGMSGTGLREVFDPQPRRSPDEVLAAVGERIANRTEADVAADKDRPRDDEVHRSNATATALMYIAIASDWSTRKVAAELDRYVWRPKLERLKQRSDRSLLFGASKPEVLAVVMRAMRAEVDAARAAAESARSASRLAHEDRDELASRLDASAARLAAGEERASRLESEIAGLRAQLEAERVERRIEQAHVIDDRTRLRSDLKRGLSSQIKLLHDALHALRSGRTKVTDEYVERVLDSISALLQALDDEPGGGA